jgi:hypothetical protein
MSEKQAPAREYVFKVVSLQWNDDSYYVAPRSGTRRETEVVATTWQEAKAEVERVLGPAMRYYHWRHTMLSSKDIRLAQTEVAP